MALLGNGVETIELGSTAWRIICNNNFGAFYTKTEIDQKTAAPIVDTVYNTNAIGPVLVDRTTATSYRLYVNNGVLSIEAVV